MQESMTMLENIHEKENLPRGPEDDVIPTRIAKLNEHRKYLEQQIDTLKRDIAGVDVDVRLLLGRAKELHIAEDLEYKIIEIPHYPNKHVDVEALKRLAPDRYNSIVANLTEIAKDKLKAQMEKIQVSIAQSDVKAAIRDKALLVQIIPEQTTPDRYDISVVRK
jgi:predicted metal-dependent hydrolase